MASTRRRGAVATVATLAVLLSSVLAGCSVSSDDDSADRDRSAAADPTPTPTEPAESSAAPSPSPSPSPSASKAPTPAATPEGALLEASEMPQLNESSAWSAGRTGQARTEPFGLCQKFDLLTIGAMTVVERDLTSRGDSAGQQVAEFADAQTAVRTSKVLESWHRDCAGRIQGRKVRVRPISDVQVSAGTGWWYLASFRRGGTGHFHSLGVVLSGKRMTVLRMEHDGQDHDYDPGRDPMELAVQAAAARLG